MTTTQLIINITLITLVLGLTGATIALLVGLNNLEKRQIMTEETACEQNNAKLTNNQQKILICKQNLTNKQILITRTGQPQP